MNIQIVLFDGFDELDVIGPYEVLGVTRPKKENCTLRNIFTYSS